MGSLIEEFESIYWQQNKRVVGIDEAGRGPMAGPCMVSAVVFPLGFYDARINDSKKLSAKKREALRTLIVDNALWHQTLEVGVDVIDEKNIYRAVHDAMRELALASGCCVVLTDAMPLSLDGVEVQAIVKGDARSMSIAAASILAKTARDALMKRLDESYPEYGFASNMGYGTPKHKQAMLKYGRTIHHRKTFKFKDET